MSFAIGVASSHWTNASHCVLLTKSQAFCTSLGARASLVTGNCTTRQPSGMAAKAALQGGSCNGSCGSAGRVGLENTHAEAGGRMFVDCDLRWSTRCRDLPEVFPGHPGRWR